MQQLQAINAKAVLRYMVLPGIIPRLRAFARDGFGWLALLMALTYQGARLLPAAHPYCNPANKGRFGIRHVIAEAANNLVIKRQNIDQIIVFIALLTGFVLLVAQFILMIWSFLIKTAFAGGTPAPFAGMFNTPNPETDIALNLLAHVFGVPGMFCSADGSACTQVEGTLPTPFHEGLHAILEFYGLAVLLVGVLILLYYVVLIVGETAHTGTPFGRRFNHIWAPMRLVLAVGMLVPINYGLNTGQYLTLFSARMGSGFATNGWRLFNETLTNPSGLEDQSLLARGQAPDFQYIIKHFMLVATCKAGYETTTQNSDMPLDIRPYLVLGTTSVDLSGMDGVAAYQAAYDLYGNREMVIRFGHLDPVRFARETGYVKPYCGDIVVHKVVNEMPLARRVAEQYTALLLFFYASPINQAFGERVMAIEIEYEGEEGANSAGCQSMADLMTPGSCSTMPPHAFRQERLTTLQSLAEAQVVSIWAQRGDLEFQLPEELLNRGWGGAGIWYNKIAEWNGAWLGAVKTPPSVAKMPWPMEQVQTARRGQVAMIDDTNRYSPEVDGQPITFEMDEERQIARALNKAYKYWNEDSPNEATDVRDSSNPFINVINMIFGLEGLFTLRANHDIHPLAQLVALGKGIVDAAVRNLMAAVGSAAIAGGLEAIAGGQLAAGAFMGASSMFLSFTTVGLTVGFILYYVMPFMPFMYFFFAVGGWVKSIFEAMVGVPLWALAHLRIDGNGLPGETAMNGYFLIFEIFIRPILTVFGLLASLAIFTAMVRVLHEIFPLVTQNMTGFDATTGDTNLDSFLYTTVASGVFGAEFKRDVIDEFFFTIIYAIIVYLIGTSSFKLIDQIPNNILRWMGAGVQTFNDRRDDPAGSLVQYAAIGGSSVSAQVTGIMQQGARGVGQTTGSLFGAITGRSAGTGMTGTP